MKLSLSVFGSTTSTVEAPRGAQYSRLSGPAQIPLFSLPCFLPLRPPVPEPVNGGRRCRACGAFRRPPLAVRRACLRRRAFYASPCQATAPSLERFTHCAHSAVQLRPRVELTPSKVRNPNPCFIDVRCFFKTIWGSKMEAEMKSKSCQNRAWARWKPFWPPCWSIFGPLEP